MSDVFENLEAGEAVADENASTVNANNTSSATDAVAEVRTIFDGKALDALFGYTLRRLGVIFLITCPLFIVLGVLLLITDSFELGLFCVLFAVLYPLGMWLLMFFSKRQQKKSLSLLSTSTVNVFRFEKDRLLAEMKAANSTSNSDIVYENIHKAAETKTHFFIFISSAQAFVVPKSDFVSGSVDALRVLLIGKMGKKFKTGVKL